VGLVYDHRELPEVMIVIPEVAGVLQFARTPVTDHDIRVFLERKRKYHQRPEVTTVMPRCLGCYNLQGHQ
jgi:hypothetical protein